MQIGTLFSEVKYLVKIMKRLYLPISEIVFEMYIVTNATKFPEFVPLNKLPTA